MLSSLLAFAAISEPSTLLFKREEVTMSTKGREAAKMAAIIGGGAVIGAALGLLLAPKTGAEMRRDVARYAKRAQLQATRFGRSVKTGVSSVVERSRALVKKDDHKEAA
ncbi:MAG: hypothetical protein GDA66_03045 [Nitrospira sp. CR1.2]|nr:hypothetical protein [Nitrospira sp. CR1.2]